MNHISIEPLTAAHAEAMFEILSDPELYRYENAPPSSLEWLRERYTRLESRSSPDGSEHWLNWIIHLSDVEAIGFVQATVQMDGQATIAYMLASKEWGKGIARRGVEMMIDELANHYQVHTLWAILKEKNTPSRRLLERLGFSPAHQGLFAEHNVEPDELLFWRERENG